MQPASVMVLEEQPVRRDVLAEPREVEWRERKSREAVQRIDDGPPDRTHGHAGRE